MKKKLLHAVCIIFLMLCNWNLAKAQNLVPNPSFEIQYYCPFAYDWWIPNWINLNSSDVFDTCAIDQVAVPLNVMGYQYPLTGHAYAGIFTYDPYIINYREYMGQKLATPLIIDQKYYISFYINPGQFNGCYANNIGLTFTNVTLVDTMYWPNIPSFLNNHADVYTINVITDTLNWTKICGSFIADSAYNYFVIGNTFDDAHTDTIHDSNYGLFTYSGPYYYIDNVCIATDSTICFCDISADLNENKSKEEYGIFPNPVVSVLHISSEHIELFNLKIFNITGEQIFQKSIVNKNSDIDLSPYPKGIYFLQLITNKQSITKKIIKN